MCVSTLDASPNLPSLLHLFLYLFTFSTYYYYRLLNRTGIKGSDCIKLTEEVNAQLGEVISTQPTEEMFEQEITIDQTVSNVENTGNSDWDGASSW